MINQDFFRKKFSVGLCLNESLSDIIVFLENNKEWLNSVYFSLPLGMRFYSRESLAEIMITFSFRFSLLSDSSICKPLPPGSMISNRIQS